MLALLLKRTFASSELLLRANLLSDNAGARYKFRKVGRGRASGKGKTSGRGHKGQKAREGLGPHPKFEGGQTPITTRIPKWGMNRTFFKQPLEPLNFSRLYYYINKGRIDTNKPINLQGLFEAGIFSSIKYGVKLLGGGEGIIDRPLHFEVTDASQKAINAVKEKGGSVTLMFRTPKQVEFAVKPYKFELPMRDFAMPPPNMAIKWKRREKSGAILKYLRPDWLKDYKEPQVPKIPKFIRKPKPPVWRKIDYGIKIVN
jgi:large subunit ribosomal protein L15